ncbi:MAG TPA: ABC transporter permease subunit [Longimicrobium sp.]|nr:ABC transporter permease subunit [Longimicrobium sp.]
MPHALEPAAGAIYDIGYRTYEGLREGRGYAFRTLYFHSLRAAFGLNRGGRALWVPWVLFAFACFPAAVQVAASALSAGMANLISYHDYFDAVRWTVALFCAAQAPELVSRDQQHRTLPLYFSRPLRTGDYAFAKLLAMWTAVVILVLTPLLILLVGRLSMQMDFGAALRSESQFFVPILVTPVLAAVTIGTIALALSSLFARRGIATAVAFGAFFMTAPIAEILNETLEGDPKRYAALVNPVNVVQGASLAVFDKKPGRGDILDVGLGPEVFFGAVAALAVAFTLLLVVRYRRIRT